MTVATAFERVAILATAFAVFLVLFPFSGHDGEPPEQFSVFGNAVPSAEPWLAVGAGVTALVALAVVVKLTHLARRA